MDTYFAEKFRTSNGGFFLSFFLIVSCDKSWPPLELVDVKTLGVFRTQGVAKSSKSILPLANGDHHNSHTSVM